PTAIADRQVQLVPSLELPLRLVEVAGDVRHQSEVQVRARLVAGATQRGPQVQTLLKVGDGLGVVVLHARQNARGAQGCRADRWHSRGSFPASRTAARRWPPRQPAPDSCWPVAPAGRACPRRPPDCCTPAPLPRLKSLRRTRRTRETLTVPRAGVARSSRRQS